MVGTHRKASIQLDSKGPERILRINGSWTVHSELPDAGEVEHIHKETDYDSTLASYLFRITRLADQTGTELDLSALPERLSKLIKLASRVPELPGKSEPVQPTPHWIEDFGRFSQKKLSGTVAIATFTGEWVLALMRLFRGQARIRPKDFWQITKSVSVDALPIVALISFLVGVIISFLGAVTLKQFGAEFAVAYLVGFGILREMGAIMTGIIMAGRTGAAFAAQIGSMKINEEIDALKTLGISPIDFIVLPRLLALFVMMPLLTLFANVIGILSGWLVAEGLMGVPGPVFFSEMQSVIYIGDFLLGMFKSCVFGILVATAGCLRGLQSGSGADAVGVAATRAVVAGITLIIFANAVIDWAAATLGI
jgi:phospholipid/cholesterol/gamma-HCH transport system permease protein